MLLGKTEEKESNVWGAAAAPFEAGYLHAMICRLMDKHPAVLRDVVDDLDWAMMMNKNKGS